MIYRIEMSHGQDMREVTADRFSTEDGWLVFWQRPATGGQREYWRVRLEHVVSMETKP